MDDVSPNDFFLNTWHFAPYNSSFWPWIPWIPWMDIIAHNAAISNSARAAALAAGAAALG